MRRFWLTLFLLLFAASPCFVGCGGPTAESDEEIQEEIDEEFEATDTGEEELE